jgi:hypothetical protein
MSAAEGSDELSADWGLAKRSELPPRRRSMTRRMGLFST